MKASRKIVISFAILLLAVVPLLATTWLAPDDRVVAADDTALWASSDIMASIQPGLRSDALKQLAANELEGVKKNMSEEVGYSYEQAFRVHSMAEIDIIKGYEEKGSLGECISTNYEWYVPLVSGRGTVGSARLSADEKGSWALSSYGDGHREECSLLGDLRKISKLLADGGLKNVTDIKAAYLPIYHTTMLYFKSDDQEYAMAVNEARFTDIVTNKIYTAKDFVSAFERAFGRIVPLNPKEIPLNELPLGIYGSKTK